MGKTTLTNNVDISVQVMESNSNIFRILCVLKPGVSKTIEVDSKATYREYVLILLPDNKKLRPFSADDIQELSAIEIFKDEVTGEYDWREYQGGAENRTWLRDTLRGVFTRKGKARKEAQSAGDKEASSADNKEARPADDKEAPSIDDKEVRPTDDKEARPVDGKEARPADDKEAPSIDDKEVRPADDKEALSVDDKEARPVDGKEARHADDKEARPADDKEARSADDKEAPSADDKEAPPVDDKEAPSVDDKGGAGEGDKKTTSGEMWEVQETT